MPISMPWPARALLLAALAATTALAQDSPRQQPVAPRGSAVLDQLERAMSTAINESTAQPDPILPSPASNDMRRRAFEGLRRHIDPTLDARARAAAAKGAAALAREREDQARRLRQALNLEPAEVAPRSAATPSTALRRWVPVLFVSSSMPLATLRRYAAQLEQARGVLAFRGLPGGMRTVGPMARLSAAILRIDPGCEGAGCTMRNVQLIVDPIVFRQHGVARVPALAMLPGDPAQAYCEREDESPRASQLVYGDSALPGLLDEIARLGGEKEVRDAQARLAAR